MSAVLKAAFTGGTAGRVRKFEDALAKKRDRLPHLTAAVEKAARLFEESADPAPLTAAERALEDAQKETARLERALADAQAAERAEAEEKAAAALEAEHARMRKEIEALGLSITSDFVAIGKKLSAHERLADALPANERYKFWPPDYAASASKLLTAGVKPKPRYASEIPSDVRRIEVSLDVPVVGAVD